MSTQKRVIRSWETKTSRSHLWNCRRRTNCTERAGNQGRMVLSRLARYVCAGAGGETAPLWSIFWSAWAWLATKFLQTDQTPGQLVRSTIKTERTGSPPPLEAHRLLLRVGAFGIPVSPRSSLPPIPFPSGLSRLPLTLPQAPAADQRRAERYDGKRDLYFLHAA